MGQYPQNIFGGNLDQIEYCTKVDGSILQREIFPAPAAHTKLSPYGSPGVVAPKLVDRSGLNGSELQVERHSSECVQMHNRRCQRSPHGRPIAFSFLGNWSTTLSIYIAVISSRTLETTFSYCLCEDHGGYDLIK